MTITHLFAVVGIVACLYWLMCAASEFVEWIAERETDKHEKEDKGEK